MKKLKRGTNDEKAVFGLNDVFIFEYWAGLMQYKGWY
jgi:hypothetical protein